MFTKYLLALCLFSSAALAAPEFGAMVGVSSSNVQVPTRVYNQASLLFGAEATVESTPALRLGAFWEANNLTARSGQPVPFHTGGDVAGLSHFFGFLLRFQPATDCPIFVDVKLGVNQRSVGAPPPSSDFAPGIGAAAGYRFNLGEKFSISPRIGYRILSYSVNGAAHYAHQGYDVNVLASVSL